MRPSSKKWLLLVGPLPIEGEALGGAKSAFNKMVERLEQSQQYETRVINTSRKISSSLGFMRLIKNLWAFISTYIVFVASLPTSELALLNMSSGGALKSAWIFISTAKLFKCRVILRVFGGNFHTEYLKKNAIERVLIDRSIAKLDMLALETKELCNKFSFSSKVYWLPNCRDLVASERIRTHVREVVFLSHVRQDKGVMELLRAAKLLPGCVFIKVYGSVGFDVDPVVFKGVSNVSYEGKISTCDVPNALSKADLVVLPTYYDGEGYPGIIIEAFQAGAPVVATNWKALPEVVDNGINGILVDPRSHQKLAKAILSLVADNDLYQEMTRQAKAKGEMFRCKNVYDEFIHKLDETLYSEQSQ